jgi:hypothetical protein
MSEPQELAERLIEQLLAPLAAGRDLHPLSPIGERRAVELARVCPVVEGDAVQEADRARLRVARALGPFDQLPGLAGGDWLLLCALNDLLQVTAPFLTRLFGENRPRRLLELCGRAIERAAAPATIGEALQRHATFSAALGIGRVDTHVAWWVGSRDFRGVKPPARLLAWRRVRRVHTSEQCVRFSEMGDGAEAWAPGWRDVVRRWLACSPLTALAGADRLGALFQWSGSVLGLIECGPGRTLAHRAVERCPKRARWLEVARRAAGSLPNAAAQSAASSFCDEVASRAELRGFSAGEARAAGAARAEDRAAASLAGDALRARE